MTRQYIQEPEIKDKIDGRKGRPISFLSKFVFSNRRGISPTNHLACNNSSSLIRHCHEKRLDVFWSIIVDNLFLEVSVCVGTWIQLKQRTTLLDLRVWHVLPVYEGGQMHW